MGGLCRLTDPHLFLSDESIDGSLRDAELTTTALVHGLRGTDIDDARHRPEPAENGVMADREQFRDLCDCVVLMRYVHAGSTPLTETKRFIGLEGPPLALQSAAVRPPHMPDLGYFSETSG